jgi:hypothetical protein
VVKKKIYTSWDKFCCLQKEKLRPDGLGVYWYKDAKNGKVNYNTFIRELPEYNV